MPTLYSGHLDVGLDHGPGEDPACRVAAIAPDAMHDDATYVSWLGLAALAITVAGAIFAN
jgi:hypothetical protein